MRTNRIVVNFTVCVLSLCLSEWSLVSSAAATTIVVTTNQDIANPPFNTGGLCGNGTIASLPGSDGKVSLREAIIAANNTPGVKTIIFASSLRGATIKLTGNSLALCGGHTTLNGDVNGDDIPDITVDGSALTSDVIDVVSSHNTVENLRVLAPNLASFTNAFVVTNLGVAGIAIGPTPAVATTVLDNTIAHNEVQGAIMVAAGGDVFNNRHSINATTIKHTLVRDNTVTGNPFGFLAFNFGEQNRITDLTLVGNTVSGTTGLPGILVAGGWQNPLDGVGANDNRLDLVIKENTSTENNVPGDLGGMDVLGGLFLSSCNHVIVQVLDNAFTNNIGGGMSVTAAAEAGSSDNVLDAVIQHNTVSGNSLPGGPGGIEVLGGAVDGSFGNHITAAVVENIITDNDGVGIAARAAVLNGSHNRAEVLIRGNTITGNSSPAAAGIAAQGGVVDSSDNHTTVDLLDNIISANNGAGIVTVAGDTNSSHNQLEVRIRGNTLENNAGVGIAALGGFGGGGESSGNNLYASIERNSVTNAALFGIWTTGGVGGLSGVSTEVANANQIHTVITDNTVTGTFGEGMHLDAGGSETANDNTVAATVRNNTVCGNIFTDIHAQGGLFNNPFLPDNAGTGNTLEGAIVKNTASTVVVENGAAFNVATVSQSDNAPCP